MWDEKFYQILQEEPDLYLRIKINNVIDFQNKYHKAQNMYACIWDTVYWHLPDSPDNRFPDLSLFGSDHLVLQLEDADPIDDYEVIGIWAGTRGPLNQSFIDLSLRLPLRLQRGSDLKGENP